MNDHFVPQFYLKRWSMNNSDKKLFSARYFPGTKELRWTRHAPSGTGFEPGLYGEIEERFFKPLDNDASRILDRYESESDRHESESVMTPIKLDLGEKDHDRWAVFVMGFMSRTPDTIEFVKKRYKKAGLSETDAMDQIPIISQSERAKKDLRSLTWMFARVNANLELLTCDNPLIKKKSLSHPDCVILLPMSPKHFFIATKRETLGRLPQSPREMIKCINIEIIRERVLKLVGI